MRLLTSRSCLLPLLAFSPLISAESMIISKSLNPCQSNSNFTASLFNVVFTPNNNSISFDVVGYSYISGKVSAEIEVIAYGYTAMKESIDPCKGGLDGLCPMNTGPIAIQSNIQVPQNIVAQIPSIAYSVPDLDGQVRIQINNTETGLSVACLEADLSNGKTVHQKGVEWTVAIIAGLGLIASAITSGLGHSNTAAHVAANALSLFGFFQAQAMIGMTAVSMPPIVQSWTQDFQWSMGIIHVGFLQTICTWYQRSTGGTASTILDTLGTTSVEVQKRAVDFGSQIFKRSLYGILANRQNSGGNSNVPTSDTTASGSGNQTKIVVAGIDRVGFISDIEETNIFMTGVIFFVIFVALVMLGVAVFKGVCEMLARNGKLKNDQFQDFRKGWKIVTRGILFRLTLIGFAQMCVLCLWELTQRDSVAEVILAVVLFVSMAGVLSWAALKVVRLARRSVTMHQNPAYILYSDPACLNKWGFLYVQYRATAYYFIIPVLLYLVVKGMFIAFAQSAPVVQAVGLVVIEAAFLIAVSVLRPWMDKKTNIYNISIAAINFLNSIFLLIFTNVFNQPGLVTGVMGVVFFVYNAAFALILLILVLIASIYAITSKDPDMRYQPMRDDRGSFIKSQTQLTTELDALAATARGEDKHGSYKPFEDDAASFSSGNGAVVKRQYNEDFMRPPPSPADPTLPLFPSGGNGIPRHSGPPPSYDARTYSRDVSPANIHTYRALNNSSPWQRGAGYEH